MTLKQKALRLHFWSPKSRKPRTRPTKLRCIEHRNMWIKFGRGFCTDMLIYGIAVVSCIAGQSFRRGDLTRLTVTFRRNILGKINYCVDPPFVVTSKGRRTFHVYYYQSPADSLSF